MTGTASEAKQWINKMNLSTPNQGKIRNFINRFSNEKFYKCSCHATYPKWMQTSSEFFVGVCHGVGYNFSSLDGEEFYDDWDMEKLQERYFILEYGFPEDEDFSRSCGVYESIRCENSELIIVAYTEEWEYLAIRKDMDYDFGIYRFCYFEVKESSEEEGVGILEFTNLHKVFPTYYEMLNRVRKIKYSNGTILEAKSIKNK